MPHEQNEGEELDYGSDDATFGDIEGIGQNSEDVDDMILDNPDDWSIPLESKSTKNKKSTDQTENLEIEEGKITKEGTKIDKKKKDEKDEEELTDEELEEKETKGAKEESEEEESEEEEAKPIGKMIKAKVGDKETLIDDGTVLRMKVDGKMQEVKLADVITDYNGKTNWDKKNSEFAKEKKSILEHNDKVKNYEAHLKKEMGQIVKLTQDAIAGKANPLEALTYLLDNMGQDSFVYYKKAMEAMYEEFADLYDMDEAGQQAYWTKKENQHLKKLSDRSRISQQREQENQRIISQVETAQKEFGVDWDGFNEALEYLGSLKDEKGQPAYSPEKLAANPRAVAQYAARMPYITKAETLVKPFEENMDDDNIVAIVDEVSKLLLESKGANEKDILEWLESNFGVSEAVKLLNQKVKKSGGASKNTDEGKSKFKVKTKKREDDEDDVELFDDFDFDR